MGSSVEEGNGQGVKERDCEGIYMHTMRQAPIDRRFSFKTIQTKAVQRIYDSLGKCVNERRERRTEREVCAMSRS